MRKWHINGLVLSLDLEDLKTVQKYEHAFSLMAQEEQHVASITSLSEKIQAYCNLYFHLFENLFGRKTAEQIFSGIPVSQRKYEEIYLSFLRFVVIRRVEIADRRKENSRTLAAQKQAAKRKKKKK